MSEIISLAVISVLLVLASIILFFAGIIRRKVNMILFSVLLFLAAGGVAVWTGLRVFNESWKIGMGVVRLFSAEESYIRAFGRSPYDCSSILHAENKVLNTDRSVWLHFRTCPRELARILEGRSYDGRRLSTSGWNTPGDMGTKDWFRPENMGDSIWSFKARSGQELYVSTDSTEVYYMDLGR